MPQNKIFLNDVINLRVKNVSKIPFSKSKQNLPQTSTFPKVLQFTKCYLFSDENIITLRFIAAYTFIKYLEEIITYKKY